jgi:hypothetical protein
MRMPISVVRCAAMYDITPNRPTAARSATAWQKRRAASY